MRAPILAVAALAAWTWGMAPVRAEEDIGTLLERARAAVAAADWGAAFEALEPAYLAVFEKMPLAVRHATFVAAEPESYGSYEPRGSDAFAPGEPLLVYLEPVGYDFRRREDGTFVYGFAADVAILDADGRLLGGQRDFGRWRFHSRRPNAAAFLSLRLEVGGLPEGRYRLAIRVRDGISQDSAEVVLPFEVQAGG